MKALQPFSRVKFLLVILAVLFFDNLQAQTYFRTYDFAPHVVPMETGRSIVDRQASGYSIAGYTNTQFGIGDFDWMYKKVDRLGVVQCSVILGFGKADSCFSHTSIRQQTGSANAEVLAGFYTDPNTGRRKASITFMDTLCSPQRSYWIRDTMPHEWRQVISHGSATGANLIAVTGFIAQYNGPLLKPTNKILVAQYTPGGALNWAFRYNLPINSVDEAYSICYQPLSNTYAVTGTTSAFGGRHVFILTLNMAGAPLGFFIYNPGSNMSASRRIIALPDGGFAVAGWTEFNDVAGSSQLWVFRVNAGAATIWSNVYGFPGLREQWHSMVYSPKDSTLLLTGYRISSTAGDEDILNGKLNALNGAQIWHWDRLNSTGNDRGYDLKQDFTNYNAYTGRYATNNLDSYLMKTTPAGSITAPDCIKRIEFPETYTHNPEERMDITRVQFNHVLIQPERKVVPIKEPIVCAIMIPGTDQPAPKTYELKQNYPNPFNPSTNIQFAIPEDGIVTIKIYNVAGKEVTTLLNGHRTKGSYIVTFNAENLPSGVYYYKLSSGSFTEMRKMLLIK